MSKSFAEIARHPARFGVILMIAVAVAMLALFLARLDTQAVHTDGLLEMDGNAVFNDGGRGATPGCTAPQDKIDCGTGGPASFDWADDAATGAKGLCERDSATGYIKPASTLPTTLPAGTKVVCIPDFSQTSTNDITYHTGSDKDYQDISSTPPSGDTWHCTTSANATSKADILNAAAVLTTGADGHQLVFFMAERDSEHGSVFNGFWIIQSQIDVPDARQPIPPATTAPIDCSNPGSPFNFSGAHACGDVLVLFNYDSGGRVSTSAALQWQRAANGDLKGCDGITGSPPAAVGTAETGAQCRNTTDDDGDGVVNDGCPNDDCTTPEGPGIASHAPLCLITATGNDCRANVGADDFCGRVNSLTDCKKAGCDPLTLGPGPFFTPWAPSCESGLGCTGQKVPSPTFSEAGIDLTAFNLELPCVGAFIPESRSSSTTDATLKDFALAPTGTTCASGIATDIHAGSRSATGPHNVLTDCTPTCGTTGTVIAGAIVHDAAFLTTLGPSGTAGGTITFTRYNSIDCTGAGTAETPITVSQAIGSTPQRYESLDFTTVASSPAISFKASYSGDAAKQIPASTSLCEPLNVINPSTQLFKFATVQTTATYTYQEINDGNVPLDNPNVTDDKCSSVVQVTSGSPPFNTGDVGALTNFHNGVLDPGETWNFTCITTITEATTNTAVGKGAFTLNGASTDLTVCPTPTPVPTTAPTPTPRPVLCDADETDSVTIGAPPTVIENAPSPTPAPVP